MGCLVTGKFLLELDIVNVWETLFNVCEIVTTTKAVTLRELF